MPDDSTRSAAIERTRRPTMIKGLVPSLPERGKIKIGIKGKEITSQRGNKFQPPQKLDHFVVTTMARGHDNNFLPDGALMERLGDRPTEIPVRLLYDDPTLNFPTRYACFIGRTLWCAGDGETANRRTELPKQTADGDPAQPREVQCPCFRQDPAYQGRDKCKMNGSLSVLIDGAGGLGGVWKFRTTSYNSIVGIMSSMAFIRSITGGVLANIPFVLRVQPKQATSPGDGNQVLIYIVTLEFTGDIAELQNVAHQIAFERAKMHVSIEHIEDEARRYLALAPPANAPLPGDDAADVVDEFYPEHAQSAPEPRREDFAVEPESIDDRPVYTVVDLDGVEHEFREEATAEDALVRVLAAAVSEGSARLDGAWESNDTPLRLRAAEFYESQRQSVLALERAAKRKAAAERRAAAPAPEPEHPVHEPQPWPLDDPTTREEVVPDQAPPGRDPDGAAPTPDEANDDPDRGSLEITPPIRRGKPDYRTWMIALFLPKLLQAKTTDELAFRLGDNEAHLTAARRELARDDLATLEEAIATRWREIGND